MLYSLRTALEKEKEKYKKFPVIPSFDPYGENAHGWGYVVVGYFLVEMAFKVFLHIREKNVPKTHSLSTLFKSLDHNDQNTIEERYTQYRSTAGLGLGAFPYNSLDEFLKTFDHGGELSWRYILIEKKQEVRVPLVSIDYLHEVASILCQVAKKEVR